MVTEKGKCDLRGGSEQTFPLHSLLLYINKAIIALFTKNKRILHIFIESQRVAWCIFSTKLSTYMISKDTLRMNKSISCGRIINSPMDVHAACMCVPMLLHTHVFYCRRTFLNATSTLPGHTSSA